MMTSIPGLFAAGDLRVQLTRQITTAVGDATTAAIAVEKYLTERQQPGRSTRRTSVSDLEVVALPNGQFAENCYLVADRDTREAVIIDPGEEPETFLAELDTRGWTLRAIWLTHAHIDHILGVEAVKRATGAPIHLHPDDRPLYDALPQYGELGGPAGRPRRPRPSASSGRASGSGSAAASSRCGIHRGTPRVASASWATASSSAATCSSTARSAGPICRAAITRRSSPASSTDFLSLPDSTVVHSGHGPETTIGVERLTNPWLTGSLRA